jgi:hypothetical protein
LGRSKSGIGFQFRNFGFGSQSGCGAAHEMLFKQNSPETKPTMDAMRMDTEK